MNLYEEKLKKFIADNHLVAEHLSFTASCHSVKEAAQAAHAPEDEFVKNICMIDASGNLIAAIVKGEDRASATLIGKALNIERPMIATPQEMLERTGYPAGGTPSFGYSALFLIDSKVMEKEVVYTGGGSERSLVRISTKELHRANSAKIVRIRK